MGIQYGTDLLSSRSERGNRVDVSLLGLIHNSLQAHFVHLKTNAPSVNDSSPER